jgi:hypothetical protein
VRSVMPKRPAKAGVISFFIWFYFLIVCFGWEAPNAAKLSACCAIRAHNLGTVMVLAFPLPIPGPWPNLAEKWRQEGTRKKLAGVGVSTTDCLSSRTTRRSHGF